jgi:hypothetical protein
MCDDKFRSSSVFPLWTLPDVTVSFHADTLKYRVIFDPYIDFT